MGKLQRQPTNERLRNAIAGRRGTVVYGPEELAELLTKEEIHLSAGDILDLGYILATRFGRYTWSAHVPEWLANVFTSMIQGVSPTVFCDPWAGIGLLAGFLHETVQPKEMFAFAPNQGECALGKVLVPRADWRLGDPLDLLRVIDKELDVVASILPMNARSPHPLTVAHVGGSTVDLRGDLASLIMVAASMHMSPSGIGLFVVTPSFFVSEKSVLQQFGELGLGIEAAFALPSGTFAPHTSFSTYLVVVRRKLSSRMFVGQLSGDVNTNLQIIQNFRQGIAGGSVDMGQFVAPLSFKGIDAMRTAERLASLEGQYGARAITLGELAISVNLGRSGEDFTFTPSDNTIYIPLIGRSDVVESPEDLTLKCQNYVQVLIDPTRSSSRFVARFLNSDVGKEIRDQYKSRTIIPKLSKQTLSQLLVFVPNLETQKKMLRIEANITTERNTVLALQDEVKELHRALWVSPRKAHEVEKRLSELSKRLAGGVRQHSTERLDEWCETLPFPLASILRAWQATASHDFKTKCEHLLQFFEGTAEFLGIVLLSAFSTNEVLFAPYKQKLKEAMQKQSLTFQRTTFGTWKVVVEYLGKQTRELLSEDAKKPDVAKNDRMLCAEMFTDSTLLLPAALSRKELASILSTTNKMRNDWSGHGGAVGEEEARLRNEELLAEVQKLRGVFADTWTEMQLVRALQCRPRRGVFENEVAILMGSHPEFIKELREMSTWLDVECLYLSNKNVGRALKLLPLVQVGPSPQSARNACYFFSRLEGERARFVSYHFSDRPEITDEFADVADTIKSLTQI